MKIMIRLMGGLGNQMFQYAFGRALACRCNGELILDQSLLLDKSNDNSVYTHRNYDLDIFKNLKFRWATEKEIVLFNGKEHVSIFQKIRWRVKRFFSPKKLVIQNFNQIKEEYFVCNVDSCYVGRWQSYEFFDDFHQLIRHDFELEPKMDSKMDDLTKLIRNSESVCLHVRRGDLVSSPMYNRIIGTLDMNYYDRAISKVNSAVAKAKFFIFSDDINWCRDNLKLSDSHFFVPENFSGEKGEGHLYLMSLCKHFIISNSTFAWWGAWLSQSANKIVIYPLNWFLDKSLSNPNMSQKSWIGM